MTAADWIAAACIIASAAMITISQRDDRNRSKEDS